MGKSRIREFTKNLLPFLFGLWMISINYPLIKFISSINSSVIRAAKRAGTLKAMIC